MLCADRCIVVISVSKDMKKQSVSIWNRHVCFDHAFFLSCLTFHYCSFSRLFISLKSSGLPHIHHSFFVTLIWIDLKERRVSILHILIMMICKISCSLWLSVNMWKTVRIMSIVMKAFLQRKCIHIIWNTSSYRIINDTSKNDSSIFADNVITTSKYTWWSFLFIFFYENFNPLIKFANFYFLCVAVLEVSYIDFRWYIEYSSHFVNRWKTSVFRSTFICFGCWSNYFEFDYSFYLI